MLKVSLITLGDPTKLTGGYIYQQRMAEAAPLNDAHLEFISFPEKPFPLPMLAARQVMARALEQSPDTIVIDSIVAGYLAPALVGKQLPTAMCGLLHQPPGGMDQGPVRTRLQALLDMSSYKKASRLIVSSQMLADEMLALGIGAHLLRVIPPGRDAAPNVETVPEEKLRCGKDAAFLCVANWLPRKGILHLLEAFALLPTKAGVLHLVGDTEADPAYAWRIGERVAQPDLRERVFIHGRLAPSDVRRFYNSVDVFVLPSSKEPFGMVYAEAMSAGLPVVGIKAGNLPNLIVSGMEGFLADPEDVNGLAEGLFHLATNERLRMSMGKLAKLSVARWPTWEESAGMFFESLREVTMSHPIDP